MKTRSSETTGLSETKRHLVDAGVALMRTKGYAATTVDDICAAAQVTKGAFFHYFKSKEDIARAALERFGFDRDQDMHDAPFRLLVDPLERVWGRLGYIEDSVGGSSRVTKGCLIGMLAQELAVTNPDFRELCHKTFLRLAHNFAEDLTATKAMYAPTADFDPEKLALLFSSIFQGSSMMAKAAGNNQILVDNIEQFRRYLKMLFAQAATIPTVPQKRDVQPAEVLDLALD